MPGRNWFTGPPKVQMMDTLNATQDAFEQMNRLLDQGKFKGNLFAVACKLLS